MSGELTRLAALELTARFGSPLLVTSARLLADQVAAFVGACRELLPAHSLYYSVKTNDDPELLRALSPAVEGFDVVSGREIRLLEQTFPGTRLRLVVNGPNKRDDEIALALTHDVALLNLDGLDDAKRAVAAVRAAGAPLRVAVRLAPRAAAGDWQKFGLDPHGAELDATLDLIANEPLLRLVGLHYHGSHGDAAQWASVLTEVADTYDRLRPRFPLELIDLGGGWEPAVELDAGGGWLGAGVLETELSAIATTWRRWRGEAPRLVLEPGRALCEAATVAVAQVGNVKRDRDRIFVYLDLSTGYVGGKHPCDRRVKFFMPRRPGTSQTMLVCGPNCSGSDVLGELVGTPPRSGDVLLMANAGAYTTTLRWRGPQPEPGLVWLDTAGEPRLVRAPGRWT